MSYIPGVTASTDQHLASVRDSFAGQPSQILMLEQWNLREGPESEGEALKGTVWQDKNYEQA